MGFHDMFPLRERSQVRGSKTGRSSNWIAWDDCHDNRPTVESGTGDFRGISSFCASAMILVLRLSNVKQRASEPIKSNFAAPMLELFIVIVVTSPWTILKCKWHFVRSTPNRNTMLKGGSGRDVVTTIPFKAPRFRPSFHLQGYRGHSSIAPQLEGQIVAAWIGSCTAKALLATWAVRNGGR